MLTGLALRADPENETLTPHTSAPVSDSVCRQGPGPGRGGGRAQLGASHPQLRGQLQRASLLLTSEAAIHLRELFKGAFHPRSALQQLPDLAGGGWMRRFRRLVLVLHETPTELFSAHHSSEAKRQGKEPSVLPRD